MTTYETLELLESVIGSRINELQKLINEELYSKNTCLDWVDVVDAEHVLDLLDEYDFDRLKELLETEGHSLALKEDGNVDFQKIDNQELVSVLLDHGIIEPATVDDYMNRHAYDNQFVLNFENQSLGAIYTFPSLFGERTELIINNIIPHKLMKEKIIATFKDFRVEKEVPVGIVAGFVDHAHEGIDEALEEKRYERNIW